ncbi:MAG: metal ABC transporter ATP-binding protein [Phycisphaerales bacterium]
MTELHGGTPHVPALQNDDDPPLVSMDRVCLGYGGRDILRDVSLRVHEGQFWFLLGPNGAGKSTLLRALLGFLRPTSGSIVRRADCAGPGRIGFVPQRCDLNPALPTTVREFVRLGLVGAEGGAGPSGLSAALEQCNLKGMERADYWSLSGGQRQRALLARALVRRPSLFVVDEPTTGLDPPSEDQLMASLAGLNRRERLTVLFVGHDLPLAARYATHVALFLHGGVHAGPAHAVLVPELLRRAYGLPIDLHGETAPTRSATP